MDNLEPITRNEMFLNGDDLEPITREEMILAGADLEPLTRHEWFLKKYRGSGDVTIKRLAVTENGTYSESGKAYSPVVVNVPAPPIPENAYLLNDLSDLPADIASFNDGTDLPMASLKVAVTPYQDLHGYDAPWAGGAGKNKCPINSGTITVGDFVTFSTPLPSGTYSISLKATRTPSSGSYASLVAYDKDGVAYSPIIGIPSDKLDGSIIKSEAMVFNNGLSKIYVYSIAGQWSESRNYTLTISDLQIELGSTATSYAPYSNICPIIGWDEAVVTVADDAESPTTSHEYTIDLNGTRYGGTLDVVSGVLTVDRVKMTIDGVNEKITNAWGTTDYGYAIYKTMPVGKPIKSDTLCDKFSYSDKAYMLMPVNTYVGGSGSAVNWTFILPKTVTSKDEADTWFSNNPTTVTYPLATPLTIQLTPTQVKSLEGTNNIFANCGQITEVKYFKKA